MRKAVKLLLLGGVVGAAVVAVKSFRSEEQVENLPVQAAKSAGVGAAAGGLLGLLIDLRSRRQTKRSRLKRATLDRLPSVPKLHIPKPSDKLHDLEKASRRARKAAVKAAHKARVRAEHLADASRERAEHLAEAGREKLAS
ncbi:MAG TPA: hypothetical protein VM942_09475 [Acidimicrobiales bacterium]|nr:hypothetical protein [Acidimicrobiales bacterium]